MNANTLAWAVMYAWPLVVIATYASRRSTASVARTTAWMMLLPVMFLPAMIELPFGALNKHRIAFLSIAAALLLFHRRELQGTGSWRRFPHVILIGVTLAAFQTSRTNGDSLTFGVLRLPGLGARDAIWLAYGFFVDAYVPFVIGQRVFKTERDLRDLLEVLSWSALLYAPLCLVEMRLSPQLSNWVYGYFPHSFEQTLRGTGYRPVVFMNHGLSVAMFLFSGFCAALALHRARSRVQPTPRSRAVVFGAILLLGRSLASIVYSLGALALLSARAARARTRAVFALAAVVVAYPAMRAADVFPTQAIARAFGEVSLERSSSLQFRFSQEDVLLDRAMERPLFGWGGWGRNRVYHWWGDYGDDWAGVKDSAVTDGAWIILLGTSGAVGLAGWLAMLLVPLVRYLRHGAGASPRARPLLGGLAVMLALFTVDLLPNSYSDLLLFAYAGALFTSSVRLSEEPRRSLAPPGGGEQGSRSRRGAASAPRAAGAA